MTSLGHNYLHWYKTAITATSMRWKKYMQFYVAPLCCCPVCLKLDTSQRRPHSLCIFPDNKVHGANMGPTWVLSAPDKPLVGPMNLATRVGCPFHLARLYRTDLFVPAPPAWPFMCHVWHKGELIRLWLLTYTRLKEHIFTPPTYRIVYGLPS